MLKWWRTCGRASNGDASCEVSTRANEAFLHQMLDLYEGARQLGECAFGANPAIRRFTGNVLFDEKIGGTMHQGWRVRGLDPSLRS